MTTKYYLAYGSNMNVSQMAKRCPDANVAGTAILNDYELVFRGRKYGAVATIEKKKGINIPVVIWTISKKDEANLDIYEGYPYLYRKEYLKIRLNGKVIEAMVYIMNEGRDYGLPARMYLNTIMDGYKHFNFYTATLYDAFNNSYNRSLKKELRKTSGNKAYKSRPYFLI